jgi:hypothetical protein
MRDARHSTAILRKLGFRRIGTAHDHEAREVWEWQLSEPDSRRGLIAMGDIRSPRVLYLKGGMFVLLGSTAAALLFLEQPTLKTALLLALAIWAFARAYYFAFYVIEHYIDPTYRFSGLWSFLQYLRRR